MGSVRLRVLAVSAALALAVAGCSSSPDTAAGSASPTEAVAAFMHALGDKSSDAACSQANCNARAGSASFADMTGATVTGDKATVSKAQITNVPDGFQNDIDLVKLNGRWYIDSKQ